MVNTRMVKRMGWSMTVRAARKRQHICPVKRGLERGGTYASERSAVYATRLDTVYHKIIIDLQ